MLRRLFLLYAEVKFFQNIWQITCWPLAFTFYKALPPLFLEILSYMCIVIIFFSYCVHNKENLFGLITEYDEILKFVRIALHWIFKVYLDKGQFLIIWIHNPIWINLSLIHFNTQCYLFFKWEQFLMRDLRKLFSLLQMNFRRDTRKTAHTNPVTRKYVMMNRNKYIHDFWMTTFYFAFS